MGEGPGADEDAKGIPFIGKAGQVLRGIILEVGLSLDKVFFTNLVKCLPTDGTMNTRGYYQFRKPKQLEIGACSPYLEKQLQLINPKVVIPLGNVPTWEWFPGTTMGETHGVLRHTGSYLVAPTYHPSHVARGATQLREVMVSDIRRACEYGSVPITTKGTTL